MSDRTDNDWSSVSETMALHILNQGAEYLRSQVQIAIAADQRATTMASLLTTIAVAVIAAAMAYWDKTGSSPALVGGLTGASILLVAAAFGVYAARPVDFYCPGNQPSNWYPIRLANFAEAVGGEAENYDSHIAENDDLLRANQRAVTTGACIAILAPVAMALSWWLAATCSS